MMAALRLGTVLRTGLRTGWLAPRAYSNGANILPLTFGSPSQTFYNEVHVKQVDVTATTGSFGILPNHVPAISVLKPGLVSVYEDEKINKYFASTGTVTINEDGSVQIIAEEAYPIENIDAQAARSGLDECQQKVNSASSDLEKAEAMVGVEFYEALLKAVE